MDRCMLFTYLTVTNKVEYIYKKNLKETWEEIEIEREKIQALEYIARI